MGKSKDSKPVLPPPAPAGGCHHYVAKKRRYCKMLVKEGARYCGEHCAEVRIPCPYDPGHTCPADNVDKHLMICNSRPEDNPPPYLVPGINIRQDTSTEPFLTIQDIADDQLMRIVQKIEDVYREKVSAKLGAVEQLQHRSMAEELSNTEYGMYHIYDKT